VEQQLEYTDIIVEKKPPIGYIILNRPERRNAVGTEPGGTIDQISQAALEMKDDPEIRVFIVKGNGDCFCSGLYQAADQSGGLRGAPPTEEMPEATKWFTPELGKEPWARYIGRDRKLPEAGSLRRPPFFWDAFWDNPKPSIAQVHSYCLGAGLWLINVCDVVYTTPSAIFSYPPIRRGASVVLAILPPWLLGRRESMWAALSGNAITAEQAYNAGLITRIVSEDNIEEEVNKYATSVAKVPPATNMFSKMAINNYYEGLGIKQAENFGHAMVMMTENSAVPGHYFDWYDNIAKYGFREANNMQLEKYSYADELIDKERARLAKKKESGKGK
jgi:enoyl-CoA hydratase